MKMRKINSCLLKVKTKCMKKYLSRIIIVAILLTAVSCNDHFRFVISPIPGTPLMIRPITPGVGNIWIGGEWFWNGRNYAWRDGYWTLPLEGYEWFPGYWKKRNKGWFWEPGHWRK